MKRLLHAGSDGEGKMTSSKRRRRFSASEDEDLGSQFTPKRNQSPPMSKIYNSGYRSSKPAELFRKDLISAMKLPDNEQLDPDSFWYLSDTWKQEWERGVQVPVNSQNVPVPCVRSVSGQTSKVGNFKLPKKLIRNSHDQFFSNEHHVLTNVGAKAEKICRYDMDDLDCRWLSVFNEQREDYGLSTIDETTMEIVIEDLENQCSDKFQEALRTEEGLGIEYDEDVVCDVCRSPDSEEGNEMVFCDSCNICVHQACYGITTIPEGSWICRPCALNVKPQCILCPVMGGAMKSTRSGQKWAHVSCALWIPEVSIGCAEKMEPVVKISQIPASRWALICTLCRERIGACIQCSVKQCKVAYHVTCAFENHLEMKAIFDDSGEEDGVKLRSYCPKHSRRTDESVSTNCQYIGSANNNKSRKQKKEMKSSNVTDEDKHNARLQKIRMMEAEFHNYVNTKDTVSVTEVDSTVVEFIFQYWKLKRKANFNKPLMTAKANETNLLCQQQENSLYAKTKLFVQLRQDLERVRNLCYMVSRREKLYRTWLRTRESVFWKQLEVLTDDSLKLSSEDISEILEANHSDSIYDVMYSYQVSEDPEEKDEDMKDKLASPRLPNPYAKCYLKGNNSRSRRYASREASLDGSCSSSENIHHSGVEAPFGLQSSENENFESRAPTSQTPVVIKLASDPQSCGTKSELNSTFSRQKDSEHHNQAEKENAMISNVHPVESHSDVNAMSPSSRKTSGENVCDTSIDLNNAKLCKNTDSFSSYGHNGPVGSPSNKEGAVKRGRGRPRKNAVKEDNDSTIVKLKSSSNEHFPVDAAESDCKQESKLAEETLDGNCISSLNSVSDEKEIPAKRRKGRPRAVNLNRASGEESNPDILINASNADKTVHHSDQDVNKSCTETQPKCELDKFNEDSSSNDFSGVVDDSLNEKENSVRRRSSRSRTSFENKNCVQSDLELGAAKEAENDICTDSCNAFKNDLGLPFSERTEPQFNIHNTRYQMRVRSQSLNSHVDEQVERPVRSSASDGEVKTSWGRGDIPISDMGIHYSDSHGGLKMSNKNCKKTRRSSFCDMRKIAIDESLGNDNSVGSLDSPSSNDKENIVKHPKGKIKKSKIHPENKEFIITAVDSIVEKEIEKEASEYCDDKYMVDICDKQFELPESGIHNTRYQMRVRNQGNNINPEDSSVEIPFQSAKQQCEKTDNCGSVISNSSVTGKASTDPIRSRSSTPLRQSSVDAVEDGKVGPLEIKDSIRIQRRPSRRMWMNREADVASVFMVSEKPEQVRKQDSEGNLLNDQDAEAPSDMDDHSLKKSLRHNSKVPAAGELEKQKLKVNERSLSVTIELLDAALQLPISESNIATLFPKTETRDKGQFVETPLKKSRPSDFFDGDEIPKTRVENMNHPASPRLVIRLRKDPDCQNWQKGPMPTNGTTAFKVVRNDWDAEDVSKLQPAAGDTTFSDSLPSQIFPEDHQRNGHRYSMRRRTSKYTFDVS